MNNTPTPSQITRFARDVSALAREEMEVEYISGTYYCFGSELATLRLLKLYRKSEKADQGFSHNLKKFYFRIEV
jgi:hypothetical protein